MEFMIAGVDALLLSVFAVIVVIVLVFVLVGKFIVYAFGRLWGMTATPNRWICGNDLLGLSRP